MSVCFEAVERPNNYKIKNMTQKDVELSKFVMSKFFGEEEKVDTKFTINDFNRDLKKQTLTKGDIFFGKINTTVKKDGKKCRINDRKDIYLIENIETVQDSTSYTVKDFMGEQYKTSKASLTILTNSEARARAESLSSILIDSQECLSKQTSEFKLNEIKKLISSVE